MKKLITLLMSCSLALVAGAMAQQDDNSPAPKKKQHGQTQAPQEAAAPARTQDERPAARQNRGMRQEQRPERRNARSESNTHENQEGAAPTTTTDEQGARQNRGMKAQERAEQRNSRSDTNANAESGGNRQPSVETPAADTQSGNGNADAQAERQRKGHAARERSNTNENANVTTSGRPKANAQATQTETAPQMNQSKSQTNSVKTAQTSKADITTIKAEHSNFHAQAKPQQVPAVTFNQNHTITGSQNWQGQQYVAFRSYRPAYHDRAWYTSNYNRIELIGGGYYYFNGGYWYPAWGYEPSAQYYVYDGPIYAGREAVPPDQVIAEVQAALQQMGYYRGEVDGLLGPLTREALTGYQTDHGLYTTAAIDQPTLDSLGI